MVSQTISHYRVEEKLGQGAMGIVFKARDTNLDRLVALKFLDPDCVAGRERRQRFLREAKTAASLNHPPS